MASGCWVGVGVGSERQVIAVVCGSGNSDILIKLWLSFLFDWLF